MNNYTLDAADEFAREMRQFSPTEREKTLMDWSYRFGYREGQEAMMHGDARTVCRHEVSAVNSREP